MRIFDLSGKIADRFKRAEFERQVEAQLPSLMQAARGLVYQASDAEDLVHDACVKALVCYDSASFISTAGLRAWLKQILVNVYRDQYRRQQRSPVKSSKYHATSDDYANVVELVADTELSPLQSIENRNSSSVIHSAISMLPPEVRVVSVLYLISGFSYQEIADITDCPIGTVMSRLSRGRAKLRKQLDGYDPRAEHTADAVSGSEEK